MLFSGFSIPSAVRNSNAGFTLVELLIGMTIFAIGMTGIYALLSSTMSHASYSRHEVVVANLLREQMELVKNIRDTNVRNFLPWNQVGLDINSTTQFSSGIYTIENNFSYNAFQVDQITGNIQKTTVYVHKIPDASLGKTLKERFEATQVFLDNQGRYTHAHSDHPTVYASYSIITPMVFSDKNNAVIGVENQGKIQGYVIDARVIVNSHGTYREYDAKTAITDWVR